MEWFRNTFCLLLHAAEQVGRKSDLWTLCAPTWSIFLSSGLELLHNCENRLSSWNHRYIVGSTGTMYRGHRLTSLSTHDASVRLILYLARCVCDQRLWSRHSDKVNKSPRDEPANLSSSAKERRVVIGLRMAPHLRFRNEGYDNSAVLRCFTGDANQYPSPWPRL